MKLYAECIACQLSVRLRDILLVVSREEDRVKLARLAARMLIRLLETGIDNPPRLSTELHRYLKAILGTSDPYQRVKARECQAALSIYPELRAKIFSLPTIREKLEAAVRASIAGNAFDLGVHGYNPPSAESVFKKAFTAQVAGDGIQKVVELMMDSRRILFVLDNCGEAVFDRLPAEVLRSLGKEVVALVKEGCFQNDITLREAREAGLYDSFTRVVSTGTDAASIFLDEISWEARQEIEKADLVVSKGMANYEYLSEVEKLLGKTIVYLLIAKCKPVASELGVEPGTYVARIYYPRASTSS